MSKVADKDTRTPLATDFFYITAADALSEGKVPYAGIGASAGASSLSAGPSATDTTISVYGLPAGVIANAFWVVIDPYTSECEIRKVTGISTLTLTVAALTYAHAANDAVMFVSSPASSVMWFGAVGDNSTDDLTSITRAIAQANATHGDVYFPPGTYLISDEIVGKLDTVKLFGARGDAALATGLSTIKWNGGVDATKGLFSINVSSSFFEIQDINLDGNNEAGYGIKAIPTDGSQNIKECKVRGVYISGYTAVGVQVGDFTDSANDLDAYNWLFERVYTRGADQSTGFKVDAVNSVNINWISCDSGAGYDPGTGDEFASVGWDLRRGNDFHLRGCFCGALYDQATPSDNYAIEHHAGMLDVTGMTLEEFRVYKSYSFASRPGRAVLQNVYISSAAGAGETCINAEYGHIVLVSCDFASLLGSPVNRNVTIGESVVAINTNIGPTGVWDVDDGDDNIIITDGALYLNSNAGLRLSSSVSDDTNKFGIVKVRHYDTDEEDTILVMGSNAVGGNSLLLGGGSSSYNAATQIRFYSATNTATLTGSERFRLQGNGIIDFLTPMGDSTKDPTTDAPADWLQIEIGGTTYYLPAYAA